MARGSSKGERTRQNIGVCCCEMDTGVFEERDDSPDVDAVAVLVQRGELNSLRKGV